MPAVDALGIADGHVARFHIPIITNDHLTANIASASAVDLSSRRWWLASVRGVTREPDERMRQAAQHAEKIRAAVDKFVAEDIAEAARIRKASDKTLDVADETHKHPLPSLSQVGSWTGAHLDETRQRMIDAVKIWRNAGLAHEHALDMYDVAVEADRNEKTVDTAGLREVADDLRKHASRMEILDQYDNEGLFATVFACNEAIARINEKNTTIAARLNAAADQITESAAELEMASADRPRTARARPR